MEKSRKRKNRARRKKSPPGLILKLFILLGLLLLFYLPVIMSTGIDFARNNIPDIKPMSAYSFKNIPLMPLPTATITLSPTIRPTPTPVPLIGYCLNVPVLMYHHIQPNSEAIDKGQTSLSVDNGEFDLQMAYLVSSGYTVISARQLADALKNHTALPAKSIVVTMDDGYKDNYVYAFPILKKYNIVANLGVIAGLVGGSDYLSWEQIREMANSGLVRMLNHTWSHYAVSQNSPDKIRYEITTAKQQIRDATGQSEDVFIYPYGLEGYMATGILNEEGFVGGFSLIPGQWQCDSFIMSLHRTRIGNSPLSNYGL